MVANPQNITITEYWRRVRQIQHDLPDAVTLASVPSATMGANSEECDRAEVQFVGCDSLTAAKLLFSGTHRLATKEEAAQREVKRVSDLQDIARRHLAAHGIIAITLPDQGSSE